MFLPAEDKISQIRRPVTVLPADIDVPMINIVGTENSVASARTAN